MYKAQLFAFHFRLSVTPGCEVRVGKHREKRTTCAECEGAAPRGRLRLRTTSRRSPMQTTDKPPRTRGGRALDESQCKSCPHESTNLRRMGSKPSQGEQRN